MCWLSAGVLLRVTLPNSPGGVVVAEPKVPLSQCKVLEDSLEKSGWKRESFQILIIFWSVLIAAL